MSIADTSMSEAPLAADQPAGSAGAPANRRAIAKRDAVALPEPR